MTARVEVSVGMRDEFSAEFKRGMARADALLKSVSSKAEAAWSKVTGTAMRSLSRIGATAKTVFSAVASPLVMAFDAMKKKGKDLSSSLAKVGFAMASPLVRAFDAMNKKSKDLSSSLAKVGLKYRKPAVMAAGFAAAIGKALTRPITDAFAKVAPRVRSTMAAAGKYAGAGLAKASQALVSAGKSGVAAAGAGLAKASQALVSAGKSGVAAFSSIAAGAGPIGMVVSTVSSMVRPLIDMAIQSERFQKQWTMILGVTTRSSSKVEGMVGHIRSIAKVTGVAGDEIANMTSQMSEFGAEGKVLDDMVAAALDLEKVGGNKDVFLNLQKSLNDMENAGVKTMSGSALVDLWKQSGMNENRIIEAFGGAEKYKGMTNAEILDAIKSDAFTADEARNTLLATVQKMTKAPLGATAADAIKTLDTSMSSIRAKVGDLFKSSKIESVMIGALERLSKALDSDAMKAAFEIFGYMVEGAIYGLEAIGGGLKIAAQAWYFYTKLMIEAIEWLFGALSGAAKWVYDAAVGIGKAISEGFTSGIDSLKKAFAFITDTIGSGISGVKSLLKISSPSKVFEDIGINIGDGLKQGTEASMPTMADLIPRPSVNTSSVSNNSATQNNVFNYAPVGGTPEGYDVFQSHVVSMFRGMMESSGMEQL